MGLFQLTGYSQSLREVRLGTQEEVEAETIEEHCFQTCSHTHGRLLIYHLRNLD